MKIALLTNFNEFNPGFSLTGIVKDQCRMLLRHQNEVLLFVNEQYNSAYDYDMPEGVQLKKCVPFAHLIDYQAKNELTADHKQTVEATVRMLAEELADCDVAFTHDWLFQGWFLPYGLAVQQSTLRLPNMRWLHWVHSMPCSMSDWWDIKRYGSRHKLVSPTQTERGRVAEQYRGDQSDVRVIPHIKDIRSWFDFDQETWDFIDDHPGVLHADVCQVYPASADRLEAKRLDKVMRIFKAIKGRGFSVCLVCAAQWATGSGPVDNENKHLALAKSLGLSEEEFAFTSRWRIDEKSGYGKYALGLPKRMLRELLLCSNLFVFPTNQESFGLVGPEAALCGTYLVLNKSLFNQAEIFEHQAASFDFGSYHNDFQPMDWDGYLDAVAGVIVARMSENESIRSQTVARRKLNMDTLYRKFYEPIMQESRQWNKVA